jgi:hypothetical protein
MRTVLLSILALCLAGCATRSRDNVVAVIQDFRGGAADIRAQPQVVLRVAPDAELREPVLTVQYPAATSNPAARDVWLTAIDRDWSAGRGVAFQIKPAAAMKLSVSFLDGNRVAYTTWANLEGGRWQTVELFFSDWRPNPYFQPPGANKDAPLDVRAVTALGFSPQSAEAGSLSISKVVVID